MERSRTAGSPRSSCKRPWILAPPGQRRGASGALQRRAELCSCGRGETPPPGVEKPKLGARREVQKQAVVGADDDGQQSRPSPGRPPTSLARRGRPRPTRPSRPPRRRCRPGGEALVGSAPSGGERCASEPYAGYASRERAGGGRSLRIGHGHGRGGAARLFGRRRPRRRRRFFEPAAPPTFAPPSSRGDAGAGPASFFGQPRVEPPLNPFTAAPLVPGKPRPRRLPISFQGTA